MNRLLLLQPPFLQDNYSVSAPEDRLAPDQTPISSGVCYSGHTTSVTKAVYGLAELSAVAPPTTPRGQEAGCPCGSCSQVRAAAWCICASSSQIDGSLVPCFFPQHSSSQSSCLEWCCGQNTNRITCCYVPDLTLASVQHAWILIPLLVLPCG